MKKTQRKKIFALIFAIIACIHFSQTAMAKSIFDTSSDWQFSIGYGRLMPGDHHVGFDGPTVKSEPVTKIYPPPTWKLRDANVIDMAVQHGKSQLGALLSTTVEPIKIDASYGKDLVDWGYTGLYLTWTHPISHAISARVAGGVVDQKVDFSSDMTDSHNDMGARADLLAFFDWTKSIAFYGALTYLYFKEYEGGKRPESISGNYKFDYSGSSISIGIKYKL